MVIIPLIDAIYIVNNGSLILL